MSLPRIQVMGDSISIHYTPFLEECLRGAFTVVRKEAGGNSELAISVLEKRLAAGGLDGEILLFNCGLHDVRRDPVTGTIKVPAADYQRNLRTILGLAARLGATFLWVRTTPCDEAVHNTPGKKFFRFSADVRVYNDLADEVMRAAGVPIIDLHSFTLNLGPDLYCDHVHFHEAIRQRQAAYLAGWLTCWWAARRPPA